MLPLIANAAPPNVLIMLTDDQGWGDNEYSCENSTQLCALTPNIASLARNEHTALLHRFYAAASVCSPTRAALLTGRTNNRDCIDSALPCCQENPAPGCSMGKNGALPWTEFTVAKAAKKSKLGNYSTIHLGKWHLGDLWDKKLPGMDPTKWSVSNPGHHGFDEWMTTQAEASNSMSNCGCFPTNHTHPGPKPPSGYDKITPDGDQCVVGGGYASDWRADPRAPSPPALLTRSHRRVRCYPCTNYYYPNASDPRTVTDLPLKVQGDDSTFLVDQFEAFLGRSVAANRRAHTNSRLMPPRRCRAHLRRAACRRPWLAHICFHAIHEPHPAMPAFYHLYAKDPDYLGALTMWDTQVGRLLDLIGPHKENTAILYTADNGPHQGEERTDIHWSTNFLRQCKASIFEGGSAPAASRTRRLSTVCPRCRRWTDGRASAQSACPACCTTRRSSASTRTSRRQRPPPTSCRPSCTSCRPGCSAPRARRQLHTPCAARLFNSAPACAQVETDNPKWTMDGTNLFPLLAANQPTGSGLSLAADPHAGYAARPSPIGFSCTGGEQARPTRPGPARPPRSPERVGAPRLEPLPPLGGEQAVIDNNWKLVHNPKMGQCDGQPPYNAWQNLSQARAASLSSPSRSAPRRAASLRLCPAGPRTSVSSKPIFVQVYLLFNLDDDYHELHDLSASEPQQLARMRGAARDPEPSPDRILLSSRRTPCERRRAAQRLPRVRRQLAGQRDALRQVPAAAAAAAAQPAAAAAVRLRLAREHRARRHRHGDAARVLARAVLRALLGMRRPPEPSPHTLGLLLGLRPRPARPGRCPALCTGRSKLRRRRLHRQHDVPPQGDCLVQDAPRRLGQLRAAAARRVRLDRVPRRHARVTAHRNLLYAPHGPDVCCRRAEGSVDHGSEPRSRVEHSVSGKRY